MKNYIVIMILISAIGVSRAEWGQQDDTQIEQLRNIMIEIKETNKLLRELVRIQKDMDATQHMVSKRPKGR
jgi:hypothetical protein